jgi:hypothetical protein
MGNRSYVIAEKAGETTILLEANNVLPLLWVATLAADQLDSVVSLPSDSPSVEYKEAIGFSMTPDGATTQLMRRRRLIERWFGDAGGVIVEQFAGLLNGDMPERIHLDLTEYVELGSSTESFLQMLQKAIAVLDTAPTKGGVKRRPSAIKWLMDEFNLSGVEESAPMFGLAMAGCMENSREPWHREPPRPKRIPGEKLYPSNHEHLISNDGRLIVLGMRNLERLETPVIWSRVSATAQLLNLPDHIGDAWVWHSSRDGSVLVGGCTAYPGKAYKLFRYQCGQFELLVTDPEHVFLIGDADDDASVLVGERHCTAQDYQSYSQTRRAFRMEAGKAPVDIGPPGTISAARVVTPDGRYVGGYTEHGQLETRTQRAFIWSAEEGYVDLGAGFFLLDWIAISPDGQRGLLKYMTKYAGATGYQFWQRGHALRAIPALLGAKAVRISASVDAIVAQVEGQETPVLWTCDSGLRPLDLGSVTGTIEPLYVADRANAVVMGESPPEKAWCCRNILVWKDGNVERHAIHDESGDMIGWRYQNRPAELADFVTSGSLVSKGVSVSWSLEHGLQRFPDQVS